MRQLLHPFVAPPPAGAGRQVPARLELDVPGLVAVCMLPPASGGPLPPSRSGAASSVGASPLRRSPPRSLATSPQPAQSRKRPRAQRPPRSRSKATSPPRRQRLGAAAPSPQGSLALPGLAAGGLPKATVTAAAQGPPRQKVLPAGAAAAPLVTIAISAPTPPAAAPRARQRQSSQPAPTRPARVPGPAAGCQHGVPSAPVGRPCGGISLCSGSDKQCRCCQADLQCVRHTASHRRAAEPEPASWLDAPSSRGLYVGQELMHIKASGTGALFMTTRDVLQ
jgi:hypothetical protein